MPFLRLFEDSHLQLSASSYLGEMSDRAKRSEGPVRFRLHKVPELRDAALNSLSFTMPKVLTRDWWNEERFGRSPDKPPLKVSSLQIRVERRRNVL
ncbi:hypothetical protein TNCV_1347421 [Trichonephila clavipes]|nr:hypothetical protein TNCV_1347421 [Trichonephila clavipes]